MKEEYNYKLPSIWTRPSSPPYSYVGMTLEEAKKKSDGWFFNISNDNGKLLPISSAFCPTRICVKVENNVIAGIESVGF